jgi:hypothetical protein
MTDVYVYRFTSRDGPTDEDICSRQRATLEAIKGIGDPIMESQIVVDDAELDANGFFCGSVANDSHSTADVKNEIKSLTLRAASRDAEALNLDEAAGGAHKYMLQLESRELRKQAEKLRRQYEFAAAESNNHGDGHANAHGNALDFAQLGISPTAG